MADIDHHRTPAIVLGHDQTGLGALRSLHLAGIPTYIACPPGDLATRSRWYRPTPGPVAWNGKVDSQACEILRAMPLEEAVLIPGADDAALWLADIPHGELRGRFRVSTSSRDSLEVLQDKARFGQFLARTGIAHPRTFSIDNRADINAIPFDELDRVFIKPVNSQKFSQVMGTKGIWARTRKELDEIWLRLDAHGLAVMAQEYIPGNSSDHYFVDGFRDRNGNMSGLFARRRIRIFPPDFGNSSYCQSIPLADVQGAIECVTELLSKLNYRGIFSAEFKRDSRNGNFCILEVNTRAWWYVEFAARCGVNVCRMAYEDARELPVTSAPRTYATGVGCVNLYGDIKSVLAQTSAARGPRRKILGQWAHSHLHVFRFDDPKPGLSVAWNISAQLIRNNLQRLLGRK